MLLSVPIDPLNGRGSTVGASFPNFATLVSVLLKNLTAISGIILLCLLIAGGFIIMQSAGGDPKKAQQGQQLITNALTGFIIVICAYLIIQLVEIFTGLKILNPTL